MALRHRNVKCSGLSGRDEGDIVTDATFFEDWRTGVMSSNLTFGSEMKVQRRLQQQPAVKVWRELRSQK
jgi:hypothetical protein